MTPAPKEGTAASARPAASSQTRGEVGPRSETEAGTEIKARGHSEAMSQPVPAITLSAPEAVTPSAPVAVAPSAPETVTAQPAPTAPATERSAPAAPAAPKAAAGPGAVQFVSDTQSSGTSSGTAGATQQQGGRLAFTGSELPRIAALGAGALLAGAALRRRSGTGLR